MCTGRVKLFNLQRGFGFIVDAETGEDIFVHYSDIIGEGFRTLYENDSVQCERMLHGKGWKAVNVRVLNNGAASRNARRLAGLHWEMDGVQAMIPKTGEMIHLQLGTAPVGRLLPSPRV